MVSFSCFVRDSFNCLCEVQLVIELTLLKMFEAKLFEELIRSRGRFEVELFNFSVFVDDFMSSALLRRLAADV